MVSGIGGFGSFNTASLSDMRQNMFNMIDRNGDGSIDSDELTALSQQAGSSNTILNKLDTDGDSLISKIEFDAALAKMEQQMKKGDSGMSALSGMAPPPPPPPENVFDTADANGDGSVNKDELTAVMGQNGNDVDKIFSQVDTDGDGLISRTEDESFREKMKDGMQAGPPPELAMNPIGGYGQDWQSQLLDALLNGLDDTDSTSNASASLYA